MLSASNIRLSLAFALATIGSSEASLAKQPSQITVSPSSQICVRATVDQTVWPHPVDLQTVHSLSGTLMPELRRLYEERGGLDRMPNSNNRQRFFTDFDGRNPFCRDDGVNVFVSVHYSARPDGTPFIVSYSVRRGSKMVGSKDMVDVAAEIRAGRIRPFMIYRKTDVVIAEDLVRRSNEIINLMKFTTK